MKRVVYVRGKFRESNQIIKKAYCYAKLMMKTYDLEAQYIGVISEEGWNAGKLLTIKKKEKQFLLDLDKGKKIYSAELHSKLMQGKEIISDKAYFIIDSQRGVIAFWTNSNLEIIDFQKILEKMKDFVEPGIEEIFDWESSEIPLKYIFIGQESLRANPIIPKKISTLYKSVTPLDIPIKI